MAPTDRSMQLGRRTERRLPAAHRPDDQPGREQGDPDLEQPQQDAESVDGYEILRGRPHGFSQ